MVTLLICKDIIPKKALTEWSTVKGATVSFSSCTGLEESQIVVYKIPQGEFYGHVTRNRLQNIVVGSADDLKMQTALIFDIENKKYISEPIYRQYVSEFEQHIDLLDEFTLESLQSVFEDIQQERKIPAYELERPVKIALMGTVKGPDLFDVILGFGKTVTLDRLRTYLSNYKRRF